MVRGILAGLVFWIAASAAQAQNPSPADVGIVHGSPDVFKLLDSSRTWTPFGSVDPSTHIFMPATNGVITPGDCLKWGPGLTSAGAGCGSGGGGSAGPLTIYTSHAGLVTNVTTPTGGWTVQQQGFYAPGDGGEATYQWSPSSYCPGGTSGSPAAADGIVCVLPSGQSASTTGRYLLQSPATGNIDARMIGMQAGGFDNGPLMSQLISSQWSGTGGGYLYSSAGIGAFFPPLPGNKTTEYYFSKPLDWTLSGKISCGLGGHDSGQSTLVFAPGIDGVVQDFSAQGSVVEDCVIVSLGQGNGYSVPGAVTFTTSMYGYGSVPPTTWGAGDGILVSVAQGPRNTVLAVPTGAYVASVSGGNTVTLGGGAVLSGFNFGYGSAGRPQGPGGGQVVGSIASGQLTVSSLVSGAQQASIVSGNGGGSPGPCTFTIPGGTLASGGQPAAISTSVDPSGSIYNAPLTITYAGNYATPPADPVTVTACGFASLGLHFTYITPYLGSTGLYQAYLTDVFPQGYGGTIPAGTAVTGQVSGTPGGVGVYSLSNTGYSYSGNIFAGPRQQMVYDRLPAALMYSVNTTLGSNQITTTGGPSDLIQPGDFIWSDAFPWGAQAFHVSGTAGAQTIDIYSALDTPMNATVTHTGGSGKLWRLPAGIDRRVHSNSNHNKIQSFVFGVKMSCDAGMTYAFGCTSVVDERNYYNANWVGHLAAGDNTGASTYTGNFFGGGYFADIIEAGNVGSAYFGDNLNSAENYTADVGMIGNCLSLNRSVFVGMYASGANYFCMNPSGAFEVPDGSGDGGTPPLSIMPMQDYTKDMPSVGPSSLSGDWKFGATTSQLNAMQITTSAIAVGSSTIPDYPYFAYPGMTVQDLTTPSAIPSGTHLVGFGFNTMTMNNAVTAPGVQNNDKLQFGWNLASPCIHVSGGVGVFSFSKGCDDPQSTWQLGLNGFYSGWAFWKAGFGPSSSPMVFADPNDYQGYNGAGGSEVVFPHGILVASPSVPFLGNERMFCMSAAMPTETWHKRGDLCLNTAAAHGSPMGWVDISDGANFVPLANIP